MSAPLQPCSYLDSGSSMISNCSSPVTNDHDPDWAIKGWTNDIRLSRWSSGWMKWEDNNGISAYIHLTQRVIRC